jgi:WD40 repeat protein/serine/threonine protein kinase
MSTELNLLVAMRALAIGLIDDEGFRVVCRGWTEDRSRSVELRLVESFGIGEETRRRLMEDVNQRVSLAGDDPVRAYQEELAQDSRVASLVCELDDDPVVAATLDEQPRDGHVLLATLGEDPSDPTVGPNAEAAQMRYTLHRVYGKGGLGQVWMAQDRTLNRRVALKELKPGRVKQVDSPATRGILRRFLREAQITGQLQHPNIVPVYDVERRDGGLPFYTMKLVEGQTFAKAITDYHERRKTGQDDPVEFARLLQAFIGVCQAVAYANANGVVHRDLKPQNVVLGGFGEVIVLDWGEAKLVRPTNATDDVAVTEQAADVPVPAENTRFVEVTAEVADLEKTYGLVGTPAYLSPEQAEQRIDDIDQRTDVYGLGTILFHVVAGISPHGSRPGEPQEFDLRKLIDRIITGPTPRLREFDPAASLALEAVCAKAMAKSQAERYVSATELAKDVQRFLADEPVSVLNEPLSVRMSRWMKRHRTLVTTTAVALIVAIIGVSVLAAMSSRHAKVVEKANENLGTANRNLETANKNLETANKNERAASERATQKAREAQIAAESERKARLQAEAALARSRFFLAQTQAAQGRVIEANDILDSVPEEKRLIEWYCSRRQFEGSYATLFGHAKEVRAVCLSPDGRRIASVGGGTDKSPGQINVWDATTGAELLSIPAHTLAVTCVCFSPDGLRLVSGSDDQTVRLWDANTGKSIRVLRGHSKTVGSVCFAAEGTRLVSAGDDDLVKIWDVASGKEVRTLTGDRVACVSSDGRKLATAGQHTTISLWDTQSGKQVSKMSGLSTFVTSMSFSGDGLKLVSTNGDWMSLWDVRSGKVRSSHRVTGHAVTRICLSPDGRRIASASRDDTIKLWGARTWEDWQELATLKGHAKDVMAVCFTPDGQRIVSASEDKSIKIWDLIADNTCLTLPQSGRAISVAMHPQADQLAVASDDKTIRVWNTQTREVMRTLRGHTERVRAVSYRPDGQWFASGGDDRAVRLWDAASGHELKTLSGHTEAVTSVCFSPDGKYLASGSDDQTIKLWDAATGDELRTLTGHTDVITSLSFSAD